MQTALCPVQGPEDPVPKSPPQYNPESGLASQVLRWQQPLAGLACFQNLAALAALPRRPAGPSPDLEARQAKTAQTY
eukprot:CAMPEP_0177790072 /NCGR_PEP_ID=MMETSP0491_2-20121128/23127_1 /TAXON_ID=63592 /ORGANISM="Tetraselmis chuii, Strain PLY429" /LENGTH=76 /DNA_ID=CAMNT_0019312057 /DNA_START=1412 /DNA_END=1642 /DNA_ORIENTATION=-